VVSAEFGKAPEVEAGDLRGSSAIAAALVPTPEVLFLDPEEGQDLGAGVDALSI
jgi:hypothetical protein